MCYKLMWFMCLLIILLLGIENKNVDVNCLMILWSSLLKYGGIFCSIRCYFFDKLMG